MWNDVGELVMPPNEVRIGISNGMFFDKLYFPREINPTKVGFSLLLLGIVQTSLTLPSLTRRVPFLKPKGFRIAEAY